MLARVLAALLVVFAASCAPATPAAAGARIEQAQEPRLVAAVLESDGVDASGSNGGAAAGRVPPPPVLLLPARLPSRPLASSLPLPPPNLRRVRRHDDRRRAIRLQPSRHVPRMDTEPPPGPPLSTVPLFG